MNKMIGAFNPIFIFLDQSLATEISMEFKKKYQLDVLLVFYTLLYTTKNVSN